MNSELKLDRTNKTNHTEFILKEESKSTSMFND